MGNSRHLQRLPDHPLLIAAALFVLAWAAPSPAAAGMPVPGQPVPEFVLPGLVDGRTVSLRDLQGQVVLLNIWASWCTACKEEMEDLLAVQDRYRKQGFALVAISIDNSPASAIAFMQRIEAKLRRKPDLILLYDREKVVSRKYRQRSMPTSYLVDRNGNLVNIYLGSFSKNTLTTLRAEIEGALR